MMNSMAVWVLKMIVEEGDRADFLADVIGYILICLGGAAAARGRRVELPPRSLRLSAARGGRVARR